ncbi:hypothetical protein [Streptomyces lydicus]|uniref:hypothetical protein n=1 Tax=Streptomyces lydicus TaxID=47763 RepID=UPI001012AFCB|nr:hypothetical protein [Streptomyces lydicus]MCZ1012349.1 hypothetical protein [Streptomyces lydicus]
MSIATSALAITTAAREATAATATQAKAPRREPRYPHIPAVAGNANVRALLGQGIHPASGQPLTETPGADCGNCLLAYRIQLPGRDGTGASERLKCSKAPISRRGRQGIDLRPATSEQPATPACTLHCTFANWPCDPDGRYDMGAGQIGAGRDHADDWGVYAVYRIFGIDLEHQRVWVELEAEMVPDTTAPGGYTARVPDPQHSRPNQPHLYRFWTELSRLHAAQLTHPADTGQCTHELVRGGRVLTAPIDH